METIIIINNFDQKIIIENLLITNQYKLLNMCRNIFEFGYLSEKNLSIQDIKDYLDKQNFINLELFINLINLESEFYNPSTKTKTNSLKYLVETKSYKLIEFLLDLNLEHESNLINWDKYYNKINNLEFLLKKLHENDSIINKIIDLIIKKNDHDNFFKKDDSNKKSCTFCIVSKCSESIIIRLLELNLIKIDWIDNYSNNLIHWSCKRNFTNLFNLLVSSDLNNLNNLNNGNRSPLHLACINNNINFVKIMIDKQVKLELIDIDYNYPLNYAIKYGNSELVKLLLEQNLNLISNNSNFFYQIIQYQNEDMVKYFIDKNFIDINKTNLIWTLLYCGTKKYYSQMYSYGTKKVSSLLYYILDEFTNSYNGHYINDYIENDFLRM